MSVTLNGNVYDASDFIGADGRGYSRTFPATGLRLFPDSIFTDMMAEITSISEVDGVAAGAGGGYLRSDGTDWVRVEDLTPAGDGAQDLGSASLRWRDLYLTRAMESQRAGSTDFFRHRHYVPVDDDTGTVPATIVDVRRVGDAAMTTRPLRSWRNSGTELMSLGADGGLTLPKYGTGEMYAQGFWDPTLTTTGTDFDSITYNSVRGGSWFRIGRFVFVSGSILCDSVTKGSASGNILIGGIPFPVATNAVAGRAWWAGSVAQTNGDWTNDPDALVVVSGAFRLRRGAVTVTVADVATGSNSNRLAFSVIYETDAV